MNADDNIHLLPLLMVAVRQLEAALEDAAAEAELLSRSVAELGARGVHMRDTGGDVTIARALPIVAEAQRAMRALQFHDRLSQRVTHVRDALARIHAALDAGETPDWQALATAIRAGYTMEDERALFDEFVSDGRRTGRDSVPDMLPGSVELF